MPCNVGLVPPTFHSTVEIIVDQSGCTVLQTIIYPTRTVGLPQSSVGMLPAPSSAAVPKTKCQMKIQRFINFVISQLLFLNADDPKKDIKLFTNSPGDSVTAGMGIYDAMKLCNADVSTVCLGLAASMGAFLPATGTKGKRYCMSNSKVMIHQPLGSVGGVGTKVKHL
ncbi:hypothetical protein KIW84_056390 [Lathyrus oleraceus]|uniref:ATP-dependent Clp protease proteolytic subunit n=1 Tax=Pisum sativum TaxID=3888 RepID=A0A9D5AJL8_PEA|nr:hypothetical protein KIW84_056390 [Pisum sativum]